MFTFPRLLAIAAVVVLSCAQVCAQQTLGGITGAVTDPSGSAINDATVSLVEEQTSLTRSTTTSASGTYSFVNLPIGIYTLNCSHEGFDSQKTPHIAVQADRTATVNLQLKVGATTTTVEVMETPLLNAVDTTVGYVLDKAQIEAVPLPTGSFTGLAILSPGVNAELVGGTGANTGLGNQPIWANGQRDTSNTFLLNGVDASNLFNGKSTSQVTSNRVINNTGVGNQAAGGVIQGSASIYLAIGQSLPTPPTETLSEVRVNTSMYDAQQGSTSGAHIDMSTASGSNVYHGTGYLVRGTNWINAAPFFFKQDPNIPESEKNPQLHRWDAGFTLGGPIKKDKLFGFVAFQQLHVSDQEIGISRLAVPPGLTDDRSPDALAMVANNNFGTESDPNPVSPTAISPVALFLMQYKLPNGQYLIPSATSALTEDASIQDNASVPGTAYFYAQHAVADVDWIANSKDTLAGKYLYQHDPSISPYAYSNVAGFSQHLDAGSQVASLNNTYVIRPNLSTTQTFGFIREKEYAQNDQPFSPSQAGINMFGYPQLPGISIVDILGPNNNPADLYDRSLNIGTGAFAMASYTGVFQNRFMPSANAIWIRVRHSVTFGGSYAYTQLNVRNNRTNQGMISAHNFVDFLMGSPLAQNDNFSTTVFLQGDANRYYRTNQVGTYVQDKFQVLPNLSISAGLRYDWNGPLTEKYGRIYNFDPSRYSYDEGSGIVNDTGFIFAGNYKYPSAGVSNSTLTGRQWGIAPRLGFAYSPAMFNSKVVLRGGAGMYYDRGELFAYLSPGYAAGVITGGPYGVTQAPPFVSSIAPSANSTLSNPFCDPTIPGNCASAPPPPSGSPSSLVVPTRAQIASGAVLPSFAVYDRNAVLPYTINFALDLQWQPRNDIAVQVGYVGNLGRHQVIPIPFNQPQIATPGHPVHTESYTYGYTTVDANTTNPSSCQYNYSGGYPLILPNGQPEVCTYEGGNNDLRVPYIGYSAESERYSTVGTSSYNALQAHVEKRMSHGLQFGFSYTYSHTLDEQSALGLFYNGNNPLDTGDAYASADFDRTHVMNFSYVYQFPNYGGDRLLDKVLMNGWAIQGIAVFQSGQPYSVIDYSGAVGSIFYSTFDGITNPIVPLKPGIKPKQAKTGASGAFGASALKAEDFTVPDYRYDSSLAPGGPKGVPPCGVSTAGAAVCDIFETEFTSRQRNIFRQSFQKRADISIVKNTKVTENVSVRYTFDVFNFTNTTSFDVPGNSISQNGYYNAAPSYDSSVSNDENSANLYFPPSGLGYVRSTIGSQRQIQMSLKISF